MRLLGLVLQHFKVQTDRDAGQADWQSAISPVSLGYLRGSNSQLCGVELHKL